MESIKIMNHLILRQMDDIGSNIAIDIPAFDGSGDRMALITTLPLVSIASPIDEIDILISCLEGTKKELAQMMAVGLVRGKLGMGDL